MFLGIRTDSPEAELYLYDGEVESSSMKWQADRQLARELLGKIEGFITENKQTLQDVTGLFVFEGPGSFTGLRIGMSVLNTYAYAQTVPIIGARGENWREVAVQRLVKGENDRVVLPFYGADARITTPKK